MTRWLSDQELAELRPPCPGHVWGMWRTAPSILDRQPDGIIIVRPRYSVRHRNCKKCDRLQVGRIDKATRKIVAGEII